MPASHTLPISPVLRSLALLWKEWSCSFPALHRCIDNFTTYSSLPPSVFVQSRPQVVSESGAWSTLNLSAPQVELVSIVH
jgi:hypothetical protein